MPTYGAGWSKHRSARRTGIWFAGTNGAGKTTLIRIINRITAPDAGEVWFDGRLHARKIFIPLAIFPKNVDFTKK